MFNLCGTLVSFALGGILMLGAFGGNNTALAQNPGLHGPRTIDQELDHLTKELELTPEQQSRSDRYCWNTIKRFSHYLIRIRRLRAKLSPSISEGTHHKIATLLTDHQKQLEKALKTRMHNGDNNPPS
jgi:hypothetical protein